MPSRHSGDEQVVHSISSASASAAEDMAHRMRAYLLSMAIRTGSFVLAFVFGFVLHLPWLALLFIVLAAILPYPAVVIANNRDRRVAHHTVQSPQPLLTGAPPGGEAPRGPAEVIVTPEGAVIHEGPREADGTAPR